jgi:hypothetical protein
MLGVLYHFYAEEKKHTLSEKQKYFFSHVSFKNTLKRYLKQSSFIHKFPLTKAVGLRIKSKSLKNPKIFWFMIEFFTLLKVRHIY